MAFGVKGQSVQATVRADSTVMLIGDQLTIQVLVNAAQGTEVVFPNMASVFENDQLELIDQSEVLVKELGDGTRSFKQTLKVTAWDEGMYAVPALKFSYSGSQTGETTSNILMLEAQYPAVVTGDSTYMADIKPILAENYTAWDYIKAFLFNPVTIAAFATILLLALIYVLTKVLKKPKPPKTAEEIILERLAALEANNPLNQNDFREFHTQISFIIREYLSNRFKVLALESPTSEFLPKLSTDQLDTMLYNELQEVLERADLIKFAKASPLAVANKQALDYAYKLVKAVQERLAQESNKTAAVA